MTGLLSGRTEPYRGYAGLGSTSATSRRPGSGSNSSRRSSTRSTTSACSSSAASAPGTSAASSTPRTPGCGPCATAGSPRCTSTPTRARPGARSPRRAERPLVPERLDRGAAPHVLEPTALVRGAVAELVEVDPVEGLADRVAQRLPQRQLSGDPDQQALELDHPAQRRVADEPVVRLQPAELLGDPAGGVLDRARLDPEVAPSPRRATRGRRRSRPRSWRGARRTRCPDSRPRRDARARARPSTPRDGPGGTCGAVRHSDRAYPRRSRGTDAQAIRSPGRVAIRPQQDHAPLVVERAEHQHLGDERPDPLRREVDHRDHQRVLELLARVVGDLGRRAPGPDLGPEVDLSFQAGRGPPGSRRPR